MDTIGEAGGVWQNGEKRGSAVRSAAIVEVHPALCAEMVDLLEEETKIGPQEGKTAQSQEDSVKETPSTTRERVMAMRGKVVFGGGREHGVAFHPAGRTSYAITRSRVVPARKT